nr:TonB-dependent receptor [Oceanicoccus sagamiensis]
MGAKAVWLEGTLSTEVAIYHSEFTNFVESIFDPMSNLASLQNAGEAEVQGIEWEVRWATSEQLTLGFNGNISDSEFTSLSPGVSGKIVGDPMDNVPEYNYSLTADYQFDWSKSLPGFARLDYNVQGPTTTTLRGFGLLPETDDSEVLTILNGQLGLQWASFTFKLFGENLLDETDSTISTAVTSRYTQRPRRSFGIKLDYDF